MITLTENAISKLKDLFAEENNPNLKLRTFVQGGGCSGMQYGFTFDEDKNEHDFDFDFDFYVDFDSNSGFNKVLIFFLEDKSPSLFPTHFNSCLPPFKKV